MVFIHRFMLSSAQEIVSTADESSIVANTHGIFRLVFEIVCGSDSEDHSEVHAVVQHRCLSIWADLFVLEEEFIQC